MGSMMMAQPTLMYNQPMVRPANPFGNNPGAQVINVDTLSHSCLTLAYKGYRSKFIKVSHKDFVFELLDINLTVCVSGLD